MSYTVLARKYRSKTLDEVLGQTAIVTTLKNAIASGRIHHGYLFSGTRGVGKTSTARILAKSLNCLKSDGPTITPCCQCDACVAIGEGEDIDVIEIDAASNTGVDNIRDLRSNASYRPNRCRHKVYIIDEVHMLSTGAFNALLKTLEEPPAHVKFIFATTEMQKVPATIQSRVQRFEFVSIDAAVIAGQIENILQAEGISASPGVVQRIARRANGSMRDALSLLDQLLACCADRLDEEIIEAVLPTLQDEDVLAVIERITEQDAAGALQASDRALAKGQTLERFCDHLMEQMRCMMLMQVCGRDTDLIEVPLKTQDRMIALSERYDTPTYIYMINVIEELRRQVKYSGAGRALTDATVLRLAMAQCFSDITRLIDQLEGSGAHRATEPPAGAAATIQGSGAAPATATRQEAPAARASGRKPKVSTSAVPQRPGLVDDGVSGQDVAMVRSDPLVSKVLELFDGTLVNVKKTVAPDVKASGASTQTTED